MRLSCFVSARRAGLQLAWVSLMLCLGAGSIRAAGTAAPRLFLTKAAPAQSVEKLDTALKAYRFIEADLDGITEEVHSTGRISLVLDNISQNLILRTIDLRVPNFRATETTLLGEVDESFSPVSTYEGEIDGVADSQVRLLIQRDLFMGFIRQGNDYLFIEPLATFSPGAPPHQLVAYHENDIREAAAGLCGTTLIHDIGRHLRERDAFVLSKIGRQASVTLRQFNIATDADYEFYQAHGASSNTYILGILNQVDGIYRTDLNLAVVVTFQNVYTTSSNPYDSTHVIPPVTAINLLNAFVNYWNSNRTTVTRDVAHLLTGKTLNSNIVGVAYVGVACSAPTYAYGLTSDTTAWTMKIVAHENGHTLDAEHDDQPPAPILSCPGNGFLMCSAIQPSGPNQFSQKTKDAVDPYIAANATGSCLAPLTAPIVNTTAATGITTSAATLNGTVNPNGASATAYFQWGLDTTYGNTTAAQPVGSGSGDVAVSANLTVLTQNTTYHYHVVGSSANGTVYGSDMSFTTQGSSSQPTATTTAATSVSPNGATLNGVVNPNGAATTAYFQWGTTTSYGNSTPAQPIGSGTGSIPVSAPISGLSPNTPYHFQIVASSSVGTTYGSDFNFTTSGCTFTVTVSPQVFIASGGSGNANVIASSSSCHWAANSDSPWLNITSGSIGIGNDTVTFSVSGNVSTDGRSATLTIAGQSFTITQDGVSSSGWDVTIPASSLVSRSSQGQGSLAVSYGSVVSPCSPPPVALAIYGVTQGGNLITEAGVPSVSVLTNTRIFIDYSSTSNSGVAVVNPSNSSIVITMTLRNQIGQQVGSLVNWTIGPKGHMARFVSELGLSLPNPFLGTLTLSSSSPFAAVNLRSVTSGRGETLFSALPLVDLSNPPAGNMLIFPELANGNGLPTQVLLLNPSDAVSISGTLWIFDESGNPLALDFGPPVGIQSSINFSLLPSGMAKYSTTGLGSLQIGYAVVTINSGALPVGNMVFSVGGGVGLASQAGVPSSSPVTSGMLYTEVAAAPLARDTGVAIVNRNGTSATIGLTLTGLDGSVRTNVLTLNPNGHLQRFISQIFAGLPSNFKGVLTFASNVPVVPLILRFTTNQRGESIVSTLPAVSLGDIPQYPLFIPQIADGGGLQTQFILLNSSTGQCEVHIDFLNDNGAYITVPLT